MDPSPERLDLSGYVLELDESFAGTELDRTRWLPYYLPHWSSRRLSAARYSVGDDTLRLRIDADQEPWCPELDGTLRVSNLQTGVFCGPVGSKVGQHRFSPDVVVREAQPAERLYTPMYGVVEIRAAAPADPDVMVALWMIGFEDEPERSAEICVVEIFGRDVAETSAVVGLGVHPFGDPSITDDFSTERYPIDAREWHDYAVRWTPDRVEFFIDGARVKVVDQSPAYPMQLMLNIYDFSEPDPEAVGYPKEFLVDHIRGYRAG